jgi:2-amino-4-hydroxy-6-hydroxymethyldihydropteridine diphosphokinase
MPHLAYIALGSNLASLQGTPADTVLQAMDALVALGQIERRSSLYSTEAVGNTNQPAFINAAVALHTPLAPMELMSGLLDLELVFGRDRKITQPKGPRTLDLDLLIYDDLVLDSPHLTLPHAEMAKRRFVLEPLTEIAPSLVHPLLRKTIAELLAALPDQGTNRIEAVRRVTKQE